MLRIYISPNNTPEKKYIISVLLMEFLGLEYSIEFHNAKEYLISFSDSRIIFEDSFWGKNKTDDYLKLENIPSKIGYIKNNFTSGKELPIIYGSEKMVVENKTIVLGLDIFASSFFLLTRWEEYVNKVRDNLDRFPGKESVAFKNNFIDRPIVNEYIEFLWSLLKYLGYNGERKKRCYKIIPTVDVDHLFSYNKFFHIARRPLSLIKNEAAPNKSVSLNKKVQISKAWEYLNGYCKVKLKYSPDPFDNYSKLLDDSEMNNSKTYFFFLSGFNKIYDVDAPIADKRLTKIINLIKSRGHHIGFHPGFDTYNNSEIWKEAKHRLEKFVESETLWGRQHYLRFDVPKTWQIWEENKMQWDSSMGYSDVTGFRCGSCYEFTVFDVVKREKFKLKEYPLLIMDVTLHNIGLTIDDAIKNVNKIKENVKKYNGDFVFLWHNSSFNLNKWKNYQKVYEELWT